MLDFHEIADVFPMMNATMMSELVADIAANGQRHPILVFEGKVLDGRNRYKACGLAGVKPTTEPFNGDWAAAVKLVASENLHRRHLSGTQRSFAADRLAVLAQGRPSSAEKASPEAITQRDAAEMMGVSRSSVQRARRVREHGVPELVEAVQADQIPLGVATDLAALPADTQREALAAGPDAIREAVAAARPPRTPTLAAQATTSKVSTDVLGRLIMTVRAVEEIATLLAAGKAAVPPGQEQSATHAVDRLRSGAEWIASLIHGTDFSDRAFHEWMSSGGK